ncbi:MAG: Gfo/Idh/MocA family protein [Caulobacteraceae bacterium]
MATSLRAGVIGAGVFGGHHAGQYAKIPTVGLAAVLDTHPDRAQALAQRFGAEAPADLAGFLDLVDVVSIASPAASHARLALACLAAGKHVYVEKPLAVSLEDADAMVAAAAGRSLVLACGFLERAAFQALGLFAIAEAPLRIEAVRRGPPSHRGLDVTVILDLMIHDLDLALALGRSEPLAVEAEGGPDEARAEVNFEGGMIGVFTASRSAPNAQRELAIAWPSGAVEIDFLGHGFSNTTNLALDADFAERPAAKDRLGASLAAFLAAVRGEGEGPLADGRDGARALDLALAVEHALGR